MKVGGETGASQSHKVKLIFSPLPQGGAYMLAAPPPDPVDPADEPSGRPVGPVFHVIPQPFIDPTDRRLRILGPLFSPSDSGFADEQKVEEIVEKTTRQT